MPEDNQRMNQAALWLCRPTHCRESGCDSPVSFIVLSFDELPEEPLSSLDELRVTGVCHGHRSLKWDKGYVDDPLLVLAYQVPTPKTCSLRIGGELCGKPGTHLAIYLDPLDIRASRNGTACVDCTEQLKIETGRVRVVVPPEVLSLDGLLASDPGDMIQ